MIGVFNLDWRRSYRLDQIESIVDAGKGDGGDRSYKLMMKGESVSTNIGNFVYDEIMSHPLQLMPAQSGIYALAVSIGDGEIQLNKTPVIAWARCFDGSVRIVTPAGVDDGHLWKEGGGYVLMPDGTVQAVGEYMDVVAFDTLADYLDHQSPVVLKTEEAQ